MEKRSYPQLTKEQQRLVEENANLVPYMFNRNTWVMDFYHDEDEAIGDGFYSLCVAAIHYNGQKQVAFSTYASNAVLKNWRNKRRFCYRGKRFADKMPYSLDAKLFDGESTLADYIQSDSDVEDETIANSFCQRMRDLARKCIFKHSRHPDRDFDMWCDYHMHLIPQPDIAKKNGLTLQCVSHTIRKINAQIKEQLAIEEVSRHRNRQ